MDATTTAPPRIRDIRDEVGPFEDHLRAADKSPRTIESYSESARQLIAFLLNAGMPLQASATRPGSCSSALGSGQTRPMSRTRAAFVFIGTDASGSAPRLADRQGQRATGGACNYYDLAGRQRPDADRPGRSVRRRAERASLPSLERRRSETACNPPGAPRRRFPRGRTAREQARDRDLSAAYTWQADRQGQRATGGHLGAGRPVDRLRPDDYGAPT